MVSARELEGVFRYACSVQSNDFKINVTGFFEIVTREMWTFIVRVESNSIEQVSNVGNRYVVSQCGQTPLSVDKKVDVHHQRLSTSFT